MEEEAKDLIVLGAINNGARQFNKISKLTKIDPKELNDILAKLENRGFITAQEKNGWLGRLVFDADEEQLYVFDFFRNELPKFGWIKLSEIRAESSLLNYKNQDRMASIQITENTFFGSEVSITVTEIENSLK